MSNLNDDATKIDDWNRWLKSMTNVNDRCFRRKVKNLELNKKSLIKKFLVSSIFFFVLTEFFLFCQFDGIFSFFDLTDFFSFFAAYWYIAKAFTSRWKTSYGRFKLSCRKKTRFTKANQSSSLYNFDRILLSLRRFGDLFFSLFYQRKLLCIRKSIDANIIKSRYSWWTR